MRCRAHTMNFLHDEAVSPKPAEPITAKNKAHLETCRTVAQNVNIRNAHNGLCGSSAGVVTSVSMLD